MEAGATSTSDATDRVLAYAGAAERLVAYVMDGVIVGILIYLAAFVLTRLIGPTVRYEAVGGVPSVVLDGTRAVVNAVVATAITAAYFAGSWLVLGGTPGQRLLAMRVQRAEDGGRLSVAQALIRWIVIGGPFGLVSALVVPVPLLGGALGLAFFAWFVVLLVTTARDRRKRGLQDRLAGSVVLRSVRLAERA